MASLCIDSGQRGFAFTLQNQEEICVKFLHENAFVAILLPVTKRKLLNVPGQNSSRHVLAVEHIFRRVLHLRVARAHAAEMALADDRGAVVDADAEAQAASPRPLQVPRPVP